MNLDFEKIQHQVDDIDKNVAEIKKYASLSNEEFWKDKRNILAVKHLLLQAIEATAAICLHVSAKKLKRAVEGLGDCFLKLCEEGIIDKDLYHRLKAMADFRNKLVHHYERIDDELVLKYAREDLGDFEEFIKKIGQNLKLRSWQGFLIW